MTKRFIGKIRERDDIRYHGGNPQSDRSLMEEFYVKNRYFIDNKDKYTAQNRENNPILFASEELSTEERLKLPYFDSFLTRYVVHNMTRWFMRVGQYLGVVSE